MMVLCRKYGNKLSALKDILDLSTKPNLWIRADGLGVHQNFRGKRDTAVKLQKISRDKYKEHGETRYTLTNNNFSDNVAFSAFVYFLVSSCHMIGYCRESM